MLSTGLSTGYNFKNGGGGGRAFHAFATATRGQQPQAERMLIARDHIGQLITNTGDASMADEYIPNEVTSLSC